MNYALRRQKLYDLLGDKGVLFLSSGFEAHRSADDTYHFSVNRNFYYLTGIDQKDSFLLVDLSTRKETLFILDNECKRSGEFVGIISSYDKKTKIASMILRNKIVKNGEYDVFSPVVEDRRFTMDSFSVKGNDTLESYSVANDIVTFKCDIELKEFDIIRALEY